MPMITWMAHAALTWLMLPTQGAWAGAPTFQELMDPGVFPSPQRGMAVEAASLSTASWQVCTTGARITADLRRGEVRFEQRIGHQRPVAVLHLGGALRGARMTHRGPGLARVTFSHPRITVRVNGDSLFMLQAHEPLTAALERRVMPAWFASDRNNHLVLDEWGGLGLYCSEPNLVDAFDPYAETVARYRLPAGAVLWVAVCPPKPYPWERSLRDNVVWHWSDTLAYPPDDVLKSWQPYGNIVLLQSEVMLWKDWNLDFVPRLGPAEFARVRKTLHDMGMRFIVYTSPVYFLKGTALESQAMNSFENFKGWPRGTTTGENVDLFIDAITRVMKQYRPDGLYFDGQYASSPAALYALARRARALLGEDGILEWHSTQALGSAQCYLPQADAYVDFILRGEGQAGLYSSFDYLRFFVSGYNVSNSIGVLCNNDGTLNPDLASRVLQANARFHMIASWLDRPDFMKIIEQDYRPHLTPDLRKTVEAETTRRQAHVAARAASYQAEWAALKAAPDWAQPKLSLTFEMLPRARQMVSPANLEPFLAAQGNLKIRAHAHAYAFFSVPLQAEAHGLVVKVRQGGDGGMSWGPAAMLRFANGAGLRVGTRSDGMLQADILGQQLVGSSYDPQQWVWLRARWLGRWGVIERSDNGEDYEPVWRFEHGGNLSGDVSELLVGKVPYNGQPVDHSAEGPVGECEIGVVRVY
jgi:hypothetical protein